MSCDGVASAPSPLFGPHWGAAATMALTALTTRAALPRPALRSPLSLALDALDVAVVAALATSPRCCVNDRDPQTGRTPLRHLLEQVLPAVTPETLAPARAIASTLIGSGADVNRQHWIPDRGHRTPLQICLSYARHSGNEAARIAVLDTIALLCAAGADTAVVHAFDGKTPLHEVCCTRDADVAALLLRYGGAGLLRLVDQKGRNALSLVPGAGVDLTGYSHVATVNRFRITVKQGVAEGAAYRRRPAIVAWMMTHVGSPIAQRSGGGGAAGSPPRAPVGRRPSSGAIAGASGGFGGR